MGLSEMQLEKTIKEIPLMFSTPMVQAILNGTKHVTRRTRGLDVINEEPNEWLLGEFKNGIAKFLCERGECLHVKCPFGKEGDVIWVKETWNSYNMNWYGLSDKEVYLYKASGTDRNSKWKSSMFMPKKAARILLEITDIGIEKIHDITEEECIKEGIGKFTKDNVLYKYGVGGLDWKWTDFTLTPKEAFKKLWIQINGEKSWVPNPFVWVINFRKLENYAI